MSKSKTKRTRAAFKSNRTVDYAALEPRHLLADVSGSIATDTVWDDTTEP
jgi:hypothetical protein